MKGLILAGLMSAIGLMGMTESAKALPVPTLCAIGSNLRGSERSPMVGIRCEFENINGVIKAKANDMTFIWDDRLESSSTTMGIAQGDGNIILLQNAYANASENAHCAMGDMVGSRSTTVVSICITRPSRDASN
jgi:hypothetical protein